jgi:hypothetical protein
LQRVQKLGLFPVDGDVFIVPFATGAFFWTWGAPDAVRGATPIPLVKLHSLLTDGESAAPPRAGRLTILTEGLASRIPHGASTPE